MYKASKNFPKFQETRRYPIPYNPIVEVENFNQVKLVLVAEKVQHDYFQSNQLKFVFKSPFQVNGLGIGVSLAMFQHKGLHSKQRVVLGFHWRLCLCVVWIFFCLAKVSQMQES